MKKIMSVQELFLNYDEKKQYLDRLFYEQLENKNRIIKQDIKNLALEIDKIKKNINIMISFEVSNARKLFEKVKLIEKKLNLIKKEQEKISEEINKKKIKYGDYCISFVDYIKETLNAGCIFYSNEYELLIKKYNELFNSINKKLKKLKKVVNKEYTKLSKKNMKEFKKILHNSKQK